MAIHAVVRTDLMHGTDNRADMVSFRYLPSNTATAIDNGNVVLLGALISGERELYAASTPAANSPIKDVVLVATPELMYDERLRDLRDFYNEAGAACRGYHLNTNDVFSVTAEAINNTKVDTSSNPVAVAVGDIVELYAGTKLQVPGTTATASSTVVGKVIQVETLSTYTYYVIKVA